MPSKGAWASLFEAPPPRRQRNDNDLQLQRALCTRRCTYDDSRSRSTTTTIPLTPTATAHPPHLSPSPLTLALTLNPHHSPSPSPSLLTSHLSPLTLTRSSRCATGSRAMAAPPRTQRGLTVQLGAAEGPRGAHGGARMRMRMSVSVRLRPRQQCNQERC